ncbi:MAG: ATPase [Alphaproteobacteria bacterium]|nr:ATPase [Alphaproteobacteria bacterium]
MDDGILLAHDDDWPALHRQWRDQQRQAVNGITPEEAREHERKRALTIDPTTLEGRDVPPRRWLVPNLIPRGAVTLLSGDGGVGKSLLAMQLMTAGALAARAEGEQEPEKWLGMKLAPFRSLGFFCEDDAEELHRRQDAINAHYGCRFADLGATRWMERVSEDNVMLQFGYDSSAAPVLRPAFGELAEMVRAHQAELIVIDTLADVFGGNENERGQVRNFIAAIRKLAQINDGAVLLMAHPSQHGIASGSGYSGSTGWNNSVRSRLYLTRPKACEAEDEPDRRELRGMKANYAASGGKFTLRWQAGVFVREADEGWNAVTAIEQRNLAKKFAELVAIATVRGLDLSPNPSTVYAPNVVAALPEAAGLKAKALVKAMHDALREGLVRVVEKGSPSKRRQRVVPGEQAV